MLNVSQIVAPLTKGLHIDRLYRLNDLLSEELEALKILKEKLISRPVFALPRIEGRVTVDKNVCDKEIGSVLLYDQEEDPTSQLNCCHKP